MTRFADWPRRLDAYFVSLARTVFVFGVNDCATFTAGAFQAMTGVNLLDGVEYSATADVAALAESVCLKHGLKERASKYHAQRGDIVLYENVKDQALGIAALDGQSIVILADGLTRIKLSRAVKAWGI
jgi:cell wall-associated NlpC family hydrolase